MPDNTLVDELRRGSEMFSDDGWWKPEILAKAAALLALLDKRKPEPPEQPESET